MAPESSLHLQIYRRAYLWWTCRISNPTVGAPGRGDFSRVLTASSMASRSDVFFSANISIQKEAAAGFAFTFGSFSETMVPRNPPTCPSITESGNSTSVRSNLTAQSYIVRRVSELDINDPPVVRPRATRRPVISNTDLISRIDHVTRSIAECIQLRKSVLSHPGYSTIVPQAPQQLCGVLGSGPRTYGQPAHHRVGSVRLGVDPI